MSDILTREEFNKIHKGIYVAETNRYLSNPGLYAIILDDIGIYAYKNPEIGEECLGATIWSKSCRTKGDAYQAIDNYISSKRNIKRKVLKK